MEENSSTKQYGVTYVIAKAVILFVGPMFWKEFKPLQLEQLIFEDLSNGCRGVTSL